MSCRTAFLNFLGNENSLNRFKGNPLSFVPPKNHSYKLKPLPSQNLPKNLSWSCNGPSIKNFFPFTQNKSYIEVEFECRQLSNLNFYPFIKVNTYLVKHKRTSNYICMIHLQNTSIKDKFTLIYNHGANSELGDNLPILFDFCAQLKCDVIAYDYSGYGCSSNIKVTEEQIINDLILTIDFTEKTLKVDRKNIALFSFSISAVPCIEVLSSEEYSNIGTLILLSPAFSTKPSDMMLNENEELNHKSEEVLNTLRNINSQVFIIHGKLDDLVQNDYIITLAKSIKNLTEWYPSKVNHFNVLDEIRRKFYGRVNNFLEYLRSLKNNSDDNINNSKEDDEYHKQHTHSQSDVIKDESTNSSNNDIMGNIIKGNEEGYVGVIDSNVCFE